MNPQPDNPTPPTNASESTEPKVQVTEATPQAWVRVQAPGMDIAVKMDDAEAREIIELALVIAERRTKLPDKSAAREPSLTGVTRGDESCHPPAVSGEDSRHSKHKDHTPLHNE